MMRSATLALFNRSLREDTRKATPYFARMGLAGIILLFLGMAHMSMNMSRTTTAGLQFFTMVIWINVVFFTVVGLSHFASAITEEKEEMTLGLLRMTNLNPLSILLGKSTNRLFMALLYLAAQFPFTLLAVTLGGVAISQVVAAYVALAAYIVLLANLALFFSVVCRRTYAAAFFSFLTLGVSVTGILITDWIVRAFTNFGLIANPDGPLAQVPRSLAECTIAFRLSEVLATGFTGGPLCAQVFSNITLSAGLFLLSWAIFDVATRGQLGVEAGPARPMATAKTVHGRHRIFAPSRPGGHAVFWKDRHFLHNGKMGLFNRTLLLSGIFFLVIPGAIYWISNQFSPGTVTVREMLDDLDEYGWPVFWLSLVFLVLQIGWLAGRIFREELRWQTLSSLAMLPMSMRRIAYQKVAAALVVLLPTVAFMLLGLSWQLDDIGDFSLEINRSDEIVAFFCVLFYGFGQVVLGAHLIAWFSIYLKWGAFALGIFTMVIANMMFGMMSAIGVDSEDGMMAMLFVGGLAALAASVGLHEMIGHGLKTAAAKE